MLRQVQIIRGGLACPQISLVVYGKMPTVVGCIPNACCRFGKRRDQGRFN
jgi:hypothetical protein